MKKMSLESIKESWCDANAYYEEAREKDNAVSDELMNCLFFELDTTKKIIEYLEKKENLE